jgi:hypothetical protein
VSEVLRHRAHVELSADRRFAGRILRLAITASVALGVIWFLATVTLEAPPVVGSALAAGWASMPAILLASLGRPLLRYALVIPSTLVSLPLLAICLAWLPAGPVAAGGWLLVTAGILLGGWLGLWFWFRLVPVPGVLDDPFGPGRLTLIGIHVALIVIGLALASTELLRG